MGGSNRSGVQSLQCVAAGHASRGGKSIKQSSYTDAGKPQIILKVLDKTEHEVYTKFKEHPSDPIVAHVPQFEGVSVGVDKKSLETQYIRIANLLLNFTHPKVIDVKLGVRTFL